MIARSVTTASNAMLISAMGALAACHGRTNAAPLLTRVSPDTVTIGGGSTPTLTVHGHGFAPRNTVHFGALRIPDVPRTNDSVMQFAVPTDDTFLPNRGPVPVSPLAGGRYEVRVETVHGASNAMSVFLVSGRDAR